VKCLLWDNNFKSKEIKSSDDLDDYLSKLPEEFMTDSERKYSGSYYTPRDITNHIAKNTIYPWITKQASRLLIDNDYADSDSLINVVDLFTKTNSDHLQTIMEEIVGQITVCDNACGSGAFLMAAADALFHLWDLAGTQLDFDENSSQTKYRIVSKNLYGVDVNPQAIEFARLRLKLWIVGSIHLAEEETQFDLKDNLRVGNSLNGRLFDEDKKEGKINRFETNEDGVFHWFKEFPKIFSTREGGFDIVIGNPPFGVPNGIKGKYLDFLMDYQVSGCGDICGYFLERELELLKKNGMIGNVLAGSVAVNRSMTSVRDLLRASGRFNLAYFGTRPSRLFPDNEERVVLVIGEKGTPATPIMTSTNYRFTSEQRDSLFDSITYESSEGLLLGRKIGSCEGDEKTRLPKVGNMSKRKILIKLRDFSNLHRIFGDVLRPKASILEYRQSAGYFIHALHKFPYRSTKVKQLSFTTSVERDFGLLILNSSLYYLFWTTFGNNRDLPKTLISPFPFPDKNTIEVHKQKIIELAKTVNENQLSVFNPKLGRVGEFKSSKCRIFLDKADEFLAMVYGLSDPELSYVLNYDHHIRS
jgi:predicted RNA methylase